MEPSHPRSPRQGTLTAWLSGNQRAQHTSESRPSESTGSNNPNSRSGTRFRAPRGSTGQRARLAEVAKETRTVLPDILQHIPHVQASKSEALFLSTLPALKPWECPKRTPSGRTPIRIVNEDTFNAAIALASKSPDGGRVAVLNMASHTHPGGGWIQGALAQEEALCYRSSLALSLHKRYYPWKQRMGLYTPDVVVIRGDMPSGHKLLVPDVKPADLPVVSVLGIAALRCPETRNIREQEDGGSGAVVERTIYADPDARELTKDKMRLCLRMAARRGHGLLVLGALGCGAFRNPKREVAHCWLEVFAEPEFQGGWWEEVWFAVYDRKGEGNYEVFEEVLGGVEV
ncbi:hypothetical protein ACRE_064380 [Hapsidospora chrysogenum ATCC 11550]|uniref:Microbial-type PARG catalytic domain-containing protein n=1 Tax=Hapsidospora chrysogenum (strain ATCC 11550 / CBS 779.69 / DSM 880 / IAM 14645 / JCM 23072 / IMI 49137) TaxID=857340 RepID=A0A086T0G0_HAPC1|nr:hypothetical protein ACRE_064380 [Hapsidospora chrysogenum ATCC 11550]